MNTVCVDNKWYRENATDVEFLREKEMFTTRSERHHPVYSYTILEKFRDKAHLLGMELVNEKGALLKKGDRYIYTAEVVDKTHPDYNLSIGFRNFNDGSLAFSGMCGSNIFVCQNGVCSSVIIPSRQRHTKGIENIDEKIDTIFSRFLEDGKKTHEQIEMMKSTPCDDKIVMSLISRLIRGNKMGNTHICDILREYDKPRYNDNNDISVMRLWNACSAITTHDFRNPNDSVRVSQMLNNEILSIITPDFKPLGDVVDVDVDVADPEVVANPAMFIAG